MKTEVIMERELFGKKIRQKSKSEFFSATDLVNAGNRWRIVNDLPLFNLSSFLKNKKTKEFVRELEERYGKVTMKGRGKNEGTWVHPLLFIDIALALNPKLKVEVYEWLFDHLISKRNRSGDSYRNMCGHLYTHHGQKKDFPKYISSVAEKIKIKCGVDNWETATEEQLSMRDDIHKAIILLSGVMRDNDETVRIALLKVGEI